MSTEWLAKYKEVKPEEFETNPFCIYHSQWALVTAGDETKCNTMTISWGGFGTYMSKPMGTVYVRQTRYTKEFMDKFDYFTICNFPQEFKEDLKYLGTHSGRDEDKIKATKLKPIKVDQGMAFEQANAIFICKKMFHGPIEVKNLEECENKKKYFDLEDCLGFHTMYMGEVEKILIKKD